MIVRWATSGLALAGLFGCAPGGPASRQGGDSGSDGATDSDSGATDSGATHSGGGDSGAGDSGAVDSGGGDSGACANYGEAVASGAVADAVLDELSGLVVSALNPGVLWVHEDSGAEAVVFALDYAGNTVARVSLLGAENYDWEALALGPCGSESCLFVGDIGNRGTDRESFVVYSFPEPILAGDNVEVEAGVQEFRYPGEAEDAEAMVVTPSGDVVIFTKREDATAGVYSLAPGAAEATFLGDMATGAEGEDLTARATDAALWPDGSRLLLRTYFHLYEFDGFDTAALASPRSLEYALEPQGEAVAYDPAGGFWQVSEGEHPTLWYSPCDD